MTTEDDIQIYLLDLLRVNFPKAVITHIPNQVNRRGKGGMIEAGRKRKLGVLKGFPDILVALPEGRCVFVEMKAPRGWARFSRACSRRMTRRRGYPRARR